MYMPCSFLRFNGRYQGRKAHGSSPVLLPPSSGEGVPSISHFNSTYQSVKPDDPRFHDDLSVLPRLDSISSPFPRCSVCPIVSSSLPLPTPVHTTTHPLQAVHLFLLNIIPFGVFLWLYQPRTFGFVPFRKTSSFAHRRRLRPRLSDFCFGSPQEARPSRNVAASERDVPIRLFPMGDNPVGERGRPPDQLCANNRGSEVSRCGQSPAEASLPSLRPSPLSHRRSPPPSYFELDVSYHENSYYTYSTTDRSDPHGRNGDPRLLTARHSSETSHQYGTSQYTTSSLKSDVCPFKNTGDLPASKVPRGFQNGNLTSEVGTQLDAAAALPKKAKKNSKRVQDTATTKLEKSSPSPTLFVEQKSPNLLVSDVLRHAVDSPSPTALFSFASLKHTSSASNEPYEEPSNGKTLGGFEVTDDEVSDSSFSAHPAQKSKSQSASMPKRTGLPARPKSTRPAQDATRNASEIVVGSGQESHSDPKPTSSETKPRVKDNTTTRQPRSTKPLSLGEQLLIRTKKPNIRIEKVPIEKTKDQAHRQDSAAKQH